MLIEYIPEWAKVLFVVYYWIFEVNLHEMGRFKGLFHQNAVIPEAMDEFNPHVCNESIILSHIVDVLNELFFNCGWAFDLAKRFIVMTTNWKG